MVKAFWPIILVLLCSNPAWSQVKLEWQFKKGETFFAERIYTHKQSVTIKDKTSVAEHRKVLVSSVTVKDKAPGGYLLEFRIESASFQLLGERPGAGKAAEAFADKLAAKLKGGTFTAIVTSQGKVTKLQGYGGFIQKLSENDTAAEKALKALLSEEAARDDLEEIFQILPEKPVQKGDQWKRVTVEPMPPFGALHSTVEYSLEGDQGEELTIAYKIKVSYKPPVGDSDPFRVTKGSVKAEEGKGAAVFDVKRGQMVRNEKTVAIRGELAVESLGNQARVEFASENSVRVRVYAKEEEGAK